MDAPVPFVLHVPPLAEGARLGGNTVHVPAFVLCPNPDVLRDEAVIPRLLWLRNKGATKQITLYLLVRTSVPDA